MRSFRWALLSLLCLGIPSIGLARPQNTAFESSAAVPVQDAEDLVRARTQALHDALLRAMEQAVAQVAPEARSRLYLLQSRVRDYVTTYRVIEEGEQAGQFQIRVEVQFDLPRLLHDLQADAERSAAAKAQAAKPLLSVCTPIALPVALAAVSAARTAFGEQLEAAESLSAPACMQRLRDAESGRSSGTVLLAFFPDSNPQSAEIRGTLPPRSGALVHSEWKLFSANGAPLRETGEATAFADNAENAIAEAQRLSAVSSLRRLLERPGGLVHGAQGVTLSLEGISSYATYTHLIGMLIALPGVLRVEPRRFTSASGAEPGQVQVLLHTAASAETIGAALGRAPLSSLRLQVVPSGPNALRVICVASSALPTAADDNTPEAAMSGSTP